MCGAIRGDLTLADRMFTCDCGHSADRDCNAAINLARAEGTLDVLLDKIAQQRAALIERS